MRVVIDIPEEEYEGLIKEHAYKTCGIGEEYYEVIIANGTPLPKGHGDLIDKKVLMDNGYQMEPVEMWYGIKHATPVIEADKE